jgi:hypothetical protein
MPWCSLAGKHCAYGADEEQGAMTGRSRLPGGEPRKASQKCVRRGEQLPPRIAPQWRVGDRVRRQDKAGLFDRDLGDGNAEVTIANRAYRVRIVDLRPVDVRRGRVALPLGWRA